MIASKSLYTLAALLLAGFLFTACGGETATPAATVAPPAAAQAEAPTAAAPAAALPGDPKAAILQALRGQLTAGPYRTTTTITGDDFEQTATAEIAPPDRMRLSMDMGGLQMEMIYIGDQVWSKQGDGAWEVADRMGAPGAALLDEAMIADTERTITEAALIGPEVLDGVNTLLYTFTTDLKRSEVMPLASVQETRLWVDAATGRIVRQEMKDAAADMPTTTVQTVEYDPTITIEAPVN
jgi:outer membrane lipoprotein-sorting protein